MTPLPSPVQDASAQIDPALMMTMALERGGMALPTAPWNAPLDEL